MTNNYELTPLNFSQIKKDIDNYNTYFFLGAGAAISSSFDEKYRMPTGNLIKNELLKQRYEDLDDDSMYDEVFKKEFPDLIEKFPKNLTLEMVWSKLIDPQFPHAMYLQIYDILNGRKPIPTNYRLLAKLMFEGKINGIFTTNFDEKLEAAILEQHQHLKSTSRLDQNKILFISNKDDFKGFEGLNYPNIIPVYKLHGTISSPTSIKASLDDLEKLMDEKKKPLNTVLSHNNCCIFFIGYSFNDPDLLEIIDNYKENPTSCKTYICKRNPKILPEELLNKFYKPNLISIDAERLFQGIYNEYIRDLKSTYYPYQRHSSNEFLTIIPDSIVYRDNFTDPIYGQINFPNEICKIIQCGDFQRLRDIKQLSFANLLYPSATHTRFSHSLGVTYLSSLMLERKDIPIDLSDQTEYLICALLHDVSHGPFGHVLEFMYNDKEEMQKFQHEELIENFLNNSLFDLGKSLDNITINKDKLKDLLTNQSKDIFSNLISLNSIDLDRLDYVLRDSYFIGRSQFPEVKNLKYETVLENIKFNEENNEFGLNDKIYDTIEKFTITYSNLYQKVYHSPYNLSTQLMVAKAIEKAMTSGYLERNSLLYYTDTDLFNFLESSDIPLIEKLIKSVKFNRIFECIERFNPSEYNFTPAELSSNFIDNGFSPENFEELILICIPPTKENSFDKLFLYSEKTKEFSKAKDIIKNYKKDYQHFGYLFISPFLRNRKEEIRKIFQDIKNKSQEIKDPIKKLTKND